MSPNLIVMKKEGTPLNTSAPTSSMTCKPARAGTSALLRCTLDRVIYLIARRKSDQLPKQLVRNKADTEKRVQELEENIRVLLAQSRAIDCDLTQRPDEDSLRGTGHRRHPAQVLARDVQYVSVLLELQGLRCLDRQQVPLSLLVQQTHLQRCIKPQQMMANVGGWRCVLSG